MTIENGYLLHNANANDKTQPAFTLHNHFRRPYNLQCTFIIHILLAHFWPARYPHRHNIHRREWAVLSIFGKNVALLSLNKIQRKYYYIIINNIVGAIASFYLCHPKSLTMKIIHTRRKERRKKMTIVSFHFRINHAEEFWGFCSLNLSIISLFLHPLSQAYTENINTSIIHSRWCK